MKAFLLSLAMALGVLSPTTMNAQSEDWFRVDNSYNGNRFASDWALFNLGIGQEAPLGGGLLVLGVAGAGYAVARRRRSLKKGAAMLAALAMMLGLTQCRKNLETIATAPANGVYITLDVDGGSKVVVDPNGAATYATVEFEEGDIIYVGNNGKYCGYLKHNGDKFTGTIETPGSEEDYLHFYFMGNKGGESEPTSVSITDQKEKYPVISYGRSESLYQKNTTSYTATLHNYCSIMKFPIAGKGTDKQVTLKGMCNKVTVDFSKNNAKASPVNPYTYSKDGFGEIILHAEKGSATEKWAIVLPQDGVESRLYVEGCKTAFVNIPTIDTNKYYKDNINAITLEPGTADDLFSVGANTKVRFSPGNLQATGTTSSNKDGGWTWSFAAKQYDFIGAAVANNAISGNGTISSAGTVDLFGWSTASTYYGIHNSNDNADYSSDFKDWGEVANAANLGGRNDWRTLTNDEWEYLVGKRTGAVQKYGYGSVDDKNGLIILPDEWTLPLGLDFKSGNSQWENKYNSESWTLMEANGAIFLPATGYRTGNTVLGVGNGALYWLSTPENDAEARCVFFYAGLDIHNSYQYNKKQRDTGGLVRLVRSVSE